MLSNERIADANALLARYAAGKMESLSEWHQFTVLTRELVAELTRLRPLTDAAVSWQLAEQEFRDTDKTSDHALMTLCIACETARDSLESAVLAYRGTQEQGGVTC